MGTKSRVGLRRYEQFPWTPFAIARLRKLRASRPRPTFAAIARLFRTTRSTIAGASRRYCRPSLPPPVLALYLTRQRRAATQRLIGTRHGK